MIREAGQRTHNELLNIINASYDAGQLPSPWKDAIIHPIPKPKEPGKVRPISLLSCLRKTAEKMVFARLQWMVGPPHRYIYAYTQNVGRRDFLAKLMVKLTNRKVVVIFMDLEKTFELANDPAILSSLAHEGSRGKLL